MTEGIIYGASERQCMDETLLEDSRCDGAPMCELVGVPSSTFSGVMYEMCLIPKGGT